MSTPDFDSMSPEELMAWMESLARRQGADEGFTTDKVVDVPDVDPTTMQDTGPGYIPYGMSQEVWEKKQADERERKARRAAAVPVEPPAPQPPPQPPVEPPVPVPVEPPVPVPAPQPEPTPSEPTSAPSAAPAAASATPDFDSMSPEELMAWMESLARRQGADEGFTSSVVMDVPEIDPATVADTGPGYIPYGMSQDVWEKKQADERERKARRAASTSAASVPAASTPAPTPVPAPPPQAEPAFELPTLSNFIPEETTQSTPS
ncbi:MAG TPA: hypothetical protein VHL11_17220, partial [Phototrophicaceae bacterium]|nr:hypothetical protein [Phototrophicaceae bacterium]